MARAAHGGGAEFEVPLHAQHQAMTLDLSKMDCAGLGKACWYFSSPTEARSYHQ